MPKELTKRQKKILMPLLRKWIKEAEKKGYTRYQIAGGVSTRDGRKRQTCISRLMSGKYETISTENYDYFLTVLAEILCSDVIVKDINEALSNPKVK